MESILDSDWQNVASIKSLLDSPGWKIYQDRVRNLLLYELDQIRELTKNAVLVEQLNTLNQHIINRNALRLVLIAKQELIEGIETSPDSEGEHNSFEENKEV